MRKLNEHLVTLAASAVATLLSAVPASAQAAHTWVSSNGNDTFACSRASPCKTFKVALGKTAVGGDVICLDAGDFGTATIYQSVTIDCSDATASISNAGGPGIVVLAPLGVVTLRGLDINGTGTGTYGVHILEAQSVTIEDSTIINNNAAAGRGVSLDTTLENIHLIIRNSRIADNAGGGIFVQPGSNRTALVNLRNVRLHDNGTVALALSTASGSPAIFATVTDSDIDTGGASGASGIIAKAPTGTATVIVKSTTIAGNPLYGISANGAGALVGISGATVTNNDVPLHAVNGGNIESYGDNDLPANTNPATFTRVVPHS